MIRRACPSIGELKERWETLPRWEGICREYAAEEVARLRGSVHVEHSLARMGAERLWELLQTEPYVHALGALTGNQALEMAEAGLQAIYLSGWQVAADANNAGQMYPDQSLYPADSVPNVVRKINNTLRRADQIQHAEGRSDKNYFLPIVADAEAGFGGALNAFELMKAMIEAGAAAVHFEDQLASEKKCGHLGGKVLVPTSHFIRTLTTARLAADILDVPTILIARTDADAARLVTSDIDSRDQRFLTGERTAEGFYRMTGGLEVAIDRAISYAPFADLLWCETSHPDLDEARAFAEAIHQRFPGKMLAYNCSPSFNWKRKLDDASIARFQRELGAMGYRFQFITLAGFHALNLSMYELARGYRDHGMTAYAALAGARVRLRGRRRLSGDQASALRRHRLFRPGDTMRVARRGLDDRPYRLDRRGAVRASGDARRSRSREGPASCGGLCGEGRNRDGWPGAEQHLGDRLRNL